MNDLRKLVAPEERDAIETSLLRYKFFSSFELVAGLKTPGYLTTDPDAILRRHAIPDSLNGKRAIDIGCMEGALAFEMERRNAIVDAVDIHDPDDIAFNLCKAAINSDVTYTRATVYELPHIFEPGSFDLVAFRGVLYHLKDPIGALEAIAPLMKEDGLLLLSGECLVSEAFDLDGNKYDMTSVTQGEFADVPIAVCYPGRIKGVPSSIWFVPNVACIRAWLDATGYALVNHRVSESNGATMNVAGADRAVQRFEGTARRVSGTGAPEHPIFHWRKS